MSIVFGNMVLERVFKEGDQVTINVNTYDTVSYWQHYPITGTVISIAKDNYNYWIRVKFKAEVGELQVWAHASDVLLPEDSYEIF